MNKRMKQKQKLKMIKKLTMMKKMMKKKKKKKKRKILNLKETKLIIQLQATTKKGQQISQEIKQNWFFIHPINIL